MGPFEVVLRKCWRMDNHSLGQLHTQGLSRYDFMAHVPAIAKRSIPASFGKFSKKEADRLLST